jgi:hypothetical protein
VAVRFSWQICCGERKDHDGSDKATAVWVRISSIVVVVVALSIIINIPTNEGVVCSTSTMTPYDSDNNMLDRQKSSLPCMARCNYDTVGPKASESV